nr:diguanylate cyclase [Deinococcus alpinitundrae]
MKPPEFPVNPLPPQADVTAQLQVALRRADDAEERAAVAEERAILADKRADDANARANLTQKPDVTGDPLVLSGPGSRRLPQLTQADQIRMRFGMALRSVQGGMLSAVRFGSPRARTARERGLLEATTRTLRQAAQRAQHSEELDQAVRFSRALVQVARLTETPMSLYDTARQAAEIMAGPAGLDLAVLVEVDGEVVTHQVHYRSAAVSAALVDLLEQGLPRAQSLAWHSLQQNEALFIDQYQDSSMRIEALVNEAVRALAFIPLTAGDPGRGLALMLGRVGDPKPWSANDRELLLTAGHSVRLSHERQGFMERLRDAALTDPLTRLGNRRAFDETLDAAINASKRHLFSVSILSLDLDGLKEVNDQGGHAQGDRTCKALHAPCRGHCGVRTSCSGWGAMSSSRFCRTPVLRVSRRCCCGSGKPWERFVHSVSTGRM